jgi:RecJ-like exonuclease
MIEENENDSEYEFEENEDLDLQSMLETFFLEHKKNRNVVDVLCEIKRSFETHNRILNALYELLNTRFGANTPEPEPRQADHLSS